MFAFISILLGVDIPQILFFFFLQRAQMEFDILYLMGEISSAFILCEESHDTLEFP